jgi:predicted transposase YbfD/YdcC
VAIPELLDLLMLKGCIVTVDAIGCQKTIVKQIRDKGADYVVAVKRNQPQLFAHVEGAFAAADEQEWIRSSPHYGQTLDDKHGRIEQRECWVLDDPTPEALGWQDGRTLVRIRRKTQRHDEQWTDETHYYLSCLPPQASLLLGTVRAHWNIENNCHWVLDVVFREDASRTRLQHADDNLALLRKIALNLIRQHPAKGSLKRKRYRAALDEDFLLEVIQSSFNLMR